MNPQITLLAIAVITVTALTPPSLASEGTAVVISGTAVATSVNNTAHRTLFTGDPIGAGDTVGFEAGSLAGIEFEDGTRVLTTRGMLLWVGEDQGTRDLTLLFGEALVSADTAPVRLQLMDGVVNLTAPATVLVTGENGRTGHVDVLEGDVRVSWATRSIQLSRNMRAWPIGIDLVWGKRRLTRREIARRSHLLTTEGWPPRFVPQDVVIVNGHDPIEPYERAPQLCDETWHRFPWIECRLTGWGCECWDARDHRAFGPYEGEPAPTTVAQCAAAGAGHDNRDQDSDKELPEAPADSPAVAPVNGIGEPPLVLVLGTDPGGKAAVWRGVSAEHIARFAQMQTRLQSDTYHSDSRSSSSTHMLSSSHASASSSSTTSSGVSSYQGTATSTRRPDLRRSDPRGKRKKK